MESKSTQQRVTKEHGDFRIRCYCTKGESHRWHGLFILSTNIS